MFRALRIVILLTILVIAGGTTWLAKVRTTSWEQPVRVAIFPIDADGSPATQTYIRALALGTFEPIAEFFKEEAARYDLALAVPVEMYLAPQIDRVPPPAPFGANPLRVMLWSLQMRYWAWVHGTFRPTPQVRIFVLYNDPERVSSVPHSLGLQKGLIGVVHAFASRGQAAENNVIIAHELLHTLGATDKYDPATNQPIFPEGYAEPERTPRWPQRYAEIMAGRVPLSGAEADIPRSLAGVLVGTQTAQEINWLR